MCMMYSISPCFEPDPQHVIDIESLQIDEDITYAEGPIQILDRHEKQLKSRVIPLVKVLWQHHNVQEATWEKESEMFEKYPELFNA